MRISLITDAWEPQVNGVVRTLRTVVAELRDSGDEVEVIHPGLFRSIPCPTYPEIRLAPLARKALTRRIDAWSPDAIHIATEGPLGVAARRMCVQRGWAFTTAFHTRFPEYLHARLRVPVRWTYRAMRWFHGRAERVMVTTQTLADELEGRGLDNVALWSRGVDTGRFHPRPVHPTLANLPRPLCTYVGRVAVEKNLPAFLGADLPGTKLVVGDGPARAELERRFPQAVFVGAKRGEELAWHYSSSDVFVFPSRTDTYGLVLLEALASGVPCAAFPVPGPIDVLDETVGALDEDLELAVRRALTRDRGACRQRALDRTWAGCARLFRSNLAPLTRGSSGTHDSAA
ncbi:MAG: glycosyltransferase family 1 protein [Planctomycetota bacterium]|nr:glycosyltransferase family 1 protein [Planctomycetota bacterium]